jgi:hypothetical protein
VLHFPPVSFLIWSPLYLVKSTIHEAPHRIYFPVTSFILGPNMFLSILFPNNLNLCFPLSWETVVLWFRRIVAGLWLRRPWSVHVGFVVDELALGLFFSEIFSFLLPVSFHSDSILIYHLEMNNTPIGGSSLET